MASTRQLAAILLGINIFVLLTIVFKYYSQLTTLKIDFNQLKAMVLRSENNVGLNVKDSTTVEELRVDFPVEGIEFAQLAIDQKVKLFVIEPCALWPLLKLRDQKRLKERKGVPARARKCTKTKNGLNIVSFGVHLHDLPGENFISTLEGRGFRTVQFSDPNTEGGATLHLMVKKGNTLLHVSTFASRADFLYVHPLNISLFNVRRNDLRYGQYAMAFDKFDLRYSQINGVKLLFPGETLNFVFQLHYAKFLECHHDLASIWEKSYPDKLEMDEKMKQTVEVMGKLIKKNLLPIWLDGGSLIGWARHCGRVPHETDSDFMTHASLNNKKYDLAAKLAGSVKKPWYFVELFGFPWTAFEMRLYNVELSWQVDLFFLTDDSTNSSKAYVGYHTFPGVYFFKLWYDVELFKSICSAELYGTRVMIPCNYRGVLNREYGKDWVKPDERHWLRDVGEKTFWPAKHAYLTYQCLGRKQFAIRVVPYDKHATHEFDGKQSKRPKQSKALEKLVNEYKRVCGKLKRTD